MRYLKLRAFITSLLKDESGAHLEGLPAGELRLCLPLIGRFYLVRPWARP